MNFNKPRGFTLIELAVVMFITTMFLGAIIATINSALVNQSISATKSREDAIKNALTSFVSRNSRLPCPAVATLVEGAVNEGVEAVTPGTCTGTTLSGVVGPPDTRVVSGVVPWSSLGLSRDIAFDAYGNRITYIVTLAATGLTSTTLSGMTGIITTHSAGLGTLGAAPAGNQLNDCSLGAPTNPCALVVAVISHGSDGYGAFTRSGTQIPYDATVTLNDAKENSNADGKIVLKDFSGVADNPFDDIVLGITSSELLSPLIMSGGLKDAKATLNATFQLMQSSAISYAVKNRSGSSGSFQYKLPPDVGTFNAMLTTQQRTDPWGTPIVFSLCTSGGGCGGPNIKAGDNGSDIAFRLTSAGPNKSNGDSDDIVQTVTVGDLQSVFQLSGW